MRAYKKKNSSFSIGGYTITPGERKLIELPTASLYSQTPVHVPTNVVVGKNAGPRLFILAAVHGDEINGVEIVRRLMELSILKHLHGVLIAIPVVNVYGFSVRSRYFPDRRDLNRAFPGSKSGSLTARVARLLVDEVLARCTHGIDLHSGNIHSENLPHLRISSETKGSMNMAKAFNVPVILDTRLPIGSTRAVAKELSLPILVYEGGEALRFNEVAIRVGLRGILNVMRTIGMLPRYKNEHQKKYRCKVTQTSTWFRSPVSGIFHPLRQLGSDVDEGEKVGYIADPFSKKEHEVTATCRGIIIGKNTLPLVNEGDPLFHIAKLKGADTLSEEFLDLQSEIDTYD